MGGSSRRASIDWSCGGFGTLMKRGDSGGTRPEGRVAVLEKRARDMGVDMDVVDEGNIEVARSLRAGKGGILEESFVCQLAQSWIMYSL